MYKVAIRLRGVVLSLFLILVIAIVIYSGRYRPDNLISGKSQQALLKSHRDASVPHDKDEATTTGLDITAHPHDQVTLPIQSVLYDKDEVTTKGLEITPHPHDHLTLPIQSGRHAESK